MVLGESFDSVVAAAQSGAEWAFGALFDSYHAPVVRYFSSRVPRFAEDLASETWMGVARGLPTFRGDEARFGSWLFTIAHRRLADHWEEQKKRDRETADPGSLKDYVAPFDTEGSVVDGMSGREAARRVAAALPADQAEIVLLRVVAGLDVDQVAAIVGRRPGTVRVLQHRALKKLSKEFSLDPVTE